MKNARLGIILFTMLVVSSCVVGPDIISGDGEYQLKADEALILVVIDSEDEIDLLRQKQGFLTTGHEWLLRGLSNSSDDKNKHFRLIPFKIGKTFYIRYVQFAGRGAYYQVASFEHPREIRIDKQGIYFYCAIVNRKGKTWELYTPSKRMIAMARREFPGYFEKYKSVNF